MSLVSSRFWFRGLRDSRIYKPKYADDAEDRQGRSASSATAEKKPRDKSRTRTIFGRKKSVSGRS